MDGKKKKNKKKKGNNNQTRAADDVPTPPGAEETGGGGSAARQDHQDHHPRACGSAADVQSVGAAVSASASDAEPEKQKASEEENSVKILRQLEEEKNIWLQKEASMEERIRLLQDDINLCVGKEASLEDKLKDLQIRSDSSLLKEATLEDRVKWIEGIQDSWIKKETSITETIARLEEVNIGLQVQVKELKESRDNLSEENTQLKESLAVMESRIQHLETEASFPRPSAVRVTELPEGKDPNYQVVVNIPAEQLEPENIVPLEKVKGVHPEAEQQNISVDDSTKENVTAPLEAAISADYSSEYNVGMYGSGEMTQSLSGAHDTCGIPNGAEDFENLNDVRRVPILGIDNSRISEDVVSVPLDDIQVVEAEPQPVKNEMTPAELPLSDAPLIGAPFRLFSFVAKYVSGADLVNQERSRSG
ncbi:Uncharacterized protein M6B38_209635 [Iris pallida]|uniref:Uncharacterized protein n=1 Tax=Iris pallida TaxID=29817 RepID=A0AAX6E3B6_IRIPA|nr:Uncharacterized protein M6B38_209635 [Iris pallida]